MSYKIVCFIRKDDNEVTRTIDYAIALHTSEKMTIKLVSTIELQVKYFFDERWLNKRIPMEGQ
jgi:hypothetical protein